jgi:hypothetical protein
LAGLGDWQRVEFRHGHVYAGRYLACLQHCHEPWVRDSGDAPCILQQYPGARLPRHAQQHRPIDMLIACAVGLHVAICGQERFDAEASYDRSRRQGITGARDTNLLGNAAYSSAGSV